MRIAFLGTPDFAVPSLDALARAGHDVLCVVCQPDRPAGRGQEIREPATKRWATARGVPVLQPEKVRDGRLAAELSRRSPDLLAVVAYGRILGEDLLELAPHGAANVHASLLPRYRGAAPIQWALAEGEKETGVTVMQVDRELDAGDILLQRAIPIAPDDTAATLHDRLAVLGGEALVEALARLERGELVPVRQDASMATLAPVLEKEHGRLDFSMAAARLACRVRGFAPWPGAFTTLAGRALKVHAAAERAGLAGLGPGRARALPDGILVGCGGGTALLITEVQLEGKKRVTAAEFLRGHPLEGDAVVGE